MSGTASVATTCEVFPPDTDQNETMTGGTSESAPRWGRLHQLDGLRAVAAILVVLNHMGATTAGPKLVERGYILLGEFIRSSTASGVEMFFILSGAVLLRSYARDGKSLSVSTYFVRRIQRIWPPYLAAWVVSGMAIFAATRWPTWWTQTLPRFSLGGWLCQAWVFYAGQDLYNVAWWSLSIELIFYAAVPLLVPLIGGSVATRRRLAVLVLLCAAVAVAAHNGYFAVLPRILTVGLAYLPCFAAGILLAKYDLPKRASWVIVTAGAVYCLLAFRHAWLNAHVGWMLVYLGVMGIALNEGTWLAGRLKTWFLVWLGERSYSLFLVHYAIFTLTYQMVSVFTPSKGVFYFVATRLIEAPLALLAAMVIFYFVERRFARGLSTADSFWPVRPTTPESED